VKVIMCVISSYLRQANSYSRMRNERNKAPTTLWMRLRPEWQPLGFALYAQVGEHGDRINDPSIAWPDNRKRVLLGRLEIKRLTANTAEEDRRLVFNPSNVPTGIETADMLSSFYSKAFRLSAKEERDVASVAGN
jgi:catalase